VNILQLATNQQNIVLPTTSLTAAIVSGNGKNMICKCITYEPQNSSFLTVLTYPTFSEEEYIASTVGCHANSILVAVFLPHPKAC